MAPAHATSSVEAAGWRTSLLAAVLVGVAALAAYANSFGVPFVFDDELAIVANPSLRSLWSAWSPPPDLQGLPISGRPVVNFSFALSQALSGHEVWSYHAMNLAVHVTAGLLLFGIVRRALRDSTLALLTALLWTLHPLQTESVTYVSQRAEALLGLWYFLALWCFIRASEPGASTKWNWGMLTAGVLGMMTKEVMVSAPLLAALYARAFLADSWREVWTRHGRRLLLLAGAWLVLFWVVAAEGGARGKSAGFGLGVSPWTYLLTQCDVIVRYIKLSVWPHPLVLDYGTGLVRSIADVWWQAALLVALFAGTCWALVRRPALACVGAWFFMILAPTSSVVPLVGQTAAEHRMYLPLAAIVVPVVLALHALLGRKAIMVTAAGALALAAATAARNADYATTIRICEDTVAKRPDNSRAMALLADYQRRAGNLDLARRWLERSLAVQPGVRPVLNNLGSIWQELGEPAKAVACYEQALALNPTDLTTLNNLGNALVMAGRVDDGLARLEAAVRLAPDATDIRANLAAALAQNGRWAAAAAHYEALLTARASDADLHADYGGVLQSLGRGAEAMAEFETAVRLRPADADLHNRLGTALGRAGRVREALPEFEEALRLNPAHEAARQNAARARQRLNGG